MPYDTVTPAVASSAFQRTATRHRATHQFMLGSGDAYVMGGRCQADWMHGVPKVEAADPKVSVIWRWTSRRGRPDSEPHNRPPR